MTRIISIITLFLTLCCIAQAFAADTSGLISLRVVSWRPGMTSIVAATAEPVIEEFGGTATYWYPKGTEVVLSRTMTMCEGCTWANYWMVNGAKKPGGDLYTITLNSPRTISAEYKVPPRPTTVVKFTVGPGGTAMSKSGTWSGKYTVGITGTLPLRAATGYVIGVVNVDGTVTDLTKQKLTAYSMPVSFTANPMNISVTFVKE